MYAAELNDGSLTIRTAGKCFCTFLDVFSVLSQRMLYVPQSIKFFLSTIFTELQHNQCKILKYVNV
jgi:hypothetical protein